MKWIMILAFLLVSCGTNISRDGLISTAASTSASVLTTTVAGPALGAIVGAAAGVAADVATKPPQQIIDLSEIPVEDRASLLKHQQIWMALEYLGVWVIGVGAFVLFILPLIAGYLMPNGRQRKTHREMVQMKEALFNRSDITTRDLKKD